MLISYLSIRMIEVISDSFWKKANMGFFTSKSLANWIFFTRRRFAAVSKLKQLESCTTGKNCEHMYD